MVLVAVLVVVAAAAAGIVVSQRRAPRHIILIVVDTLRRDALSCYHGVAPTPNIDAIARTGTVFQNAVGAFHQTTMSMAALFTGRVPSLESGVPAQPLSWDSRTWCGLARLATDGDETCVPAGVPTLAEALRAAGYRTVGFPSNDVLFRPAGFDRGFDEWFEVPSDETALVGPLPAGATPPSPLHTGVWVNHLVRAWLEKPPPERLFLYVHYMDVHDWPLALYPYTRGVELVDARIRELRAMLGEHGLLDDAVIILTADHGETLNEVHAGPITTNHFGNPAYEPVLHVPLLVSPPVGDDPTRQMRSDDVHRLIRRIARIPPGPEDGNVAADELFLGEQRFQTYRQGRWKSMWPRAGGATLLFDLGADPGEKRNLAASRPDQLAEHRRRLDELTRAFAAPEVPERPLTDEERARLRALGYAH